MAIEAEFHVEGVLSGGGLGGGGDLAPADLAGGAGVVGGAPGPGGGGGGGRMLGGPVLNDPERQRLQELFVASRALVEPIDAEKNVREQDC